MPCNTNFGFGIQRLIDAQQRYTRASTPVYVRLKNFDGEAAATKQWSHLGFSISPSGSVGTTDVLIDPPPSMTTMSLHSIGQSGGKLRFGAKQFLVSGTFVNKQQLALGLPDPKLVFTKSVGLVNENMLYSVEDVQHEAVAGAIISWIVLCNANEIR